MGPRQKITVLPILNFLLLKISILLFLFLKIFVIPQLHEKLRVGNLEENLMTPTRIIILHDSLRQKDSLLEPEMPKRKKPAETGQCVLDKILLTYPVKYLSFSYNILPDPLVIRFFPEIRRGYHRFQPKYWHSQLLEHKTIITRGIRMGLSRESSVRKLDYNALDQFVTHMKCSEIAEILHTLYAFAGRIIEKVAKNTSALYWRVCGVIIITRDNWKSFCREVLELYKRPKTQGC